MKFAGYQSDDFYDEMFLDDGTPRPEARLLIERIEGMADGELERRHAAAEACAAADGYYLHCLWRRLRHGADLSIRYHSQDRDGDRVGKHQPRPTPADSCAEPFCR